MYVGFSVGYDVSPQARCGAGGSHKDVKPCFPHGPKRPRGSSGTYSPKAGLLAAYEVARIYKRLNEVGRQVTRATAVTGPKARRENWNSEAGQSSNETKGEAI